MIDFQRNTPEQLCNRDVVAWEAMMRREFPAITARLDSDRTWEFIRDVYRNGWVEGRASGIADAAKIIERHI